MLKGRVTKSVLTICVICILLGTTMLSVVDTNDIPTVSLTETRNIIQPNMLNGGWIKTFGGKGRDRGYSVQQTHDGGYIIAGDTESFSSGGETDVDFWLIKTDANGNEEWNKTFGGKEFEICHCVRQTTDSGYILLGWQFSEQGVTDIWLIKTDTYGNEQWNRTYGDQNWNAGYCVQQTRDGGYILLCFTLISLNKIHTWLIKTDNTGNIEWSKTFGGNKSYLGESVQQTSDGGYIIAGWAEFFVAGDVDAWLIKTDSSGNEMWSKTFGGYDMEQAYSAQQTSDGGYIMTGSILKTWGQSHHEDIWLIKTDGDGKVLWKKTFGTNHYDRGKYVEQTDDGGFIIVGETVAVRSSLDYNDFDMYDIWLIKTDSLGDVEWMKKLGKERCYEYAHEVHQTLDGAYIIVGVEAPWDIAGCCNVLLIKTAEPVLRIELHGGFGIVAVITNTGEEDLANIEWSIYIDGMIHMGGYMHGIIASLPAGGEVTVGSGDFVFGFGPVTIIVILGDTAMMLRCFLLGPLILPMSR